jgi:very-short-patch-repair endonuclease
VTPSDGEVGLVRHIAWRQLPTPELEYPFARPRRWRFDLAWPAHRLAAEVEGGTWVAGRHSRGAGYEADLEKYNEATLLGWRVLRVTTHMVIDGRAIELLERAFATLGIAAGRA